MYKVAVADVQANVGNTIAVRREEDQVARLQLGFGDRVTVVLILLGSCSRNAVAKLAIHIIGQSGAVKATGGAFFTIDIVVTDKLKRILRNLFANRKRSGGGGAGRRRSGAACDDKQVRTDVARLTVVLNLIPAIVDANDVHGSAGVICTQNAVVSAGAAAHPHTIACLLYTSRCV